MKNLFNPRWILIITSFPSIILIVLFSKSFSTINTLLDPENLEVWRNHSILFLTLTIATAGYAIFLIIRNQKVCIRYAFTAFLVYIIGLYSYAYNMDSFVPSDIPGWMVPESLTHYVGSFLMPTLLYSLVLIVIWSLDNKQPSSPWYNLLYAVCIPVTIYIFINVVIPFWQPPESMFIEHSFIILAVLLTVVFLFFLLRWVYLLMFKKGTWDKSMIGFRLAFGIIFPLLGLALNNGIIVHPLGNNYNIFGDFNSLWFYGLAFVNGIFFCLKTPISPYYRLFRFLGRSLTFPFILYFFLVFMPYLPLSVFAIIIIGLGFLMLTPIVLFIFQTKDLLDDYQYLKAHFSGFKLKLISLAFISIIPLIITLSYLNDKRVLTRTLNSIYSPDYSNEQEINLSSLALTLEHIKRNRNQVNSFFESQHTPFLSSYFSWLVLDNMTLSNDKIRKIENIYFGKSTTYSISPPKSHKAVSISNVKKSSTYNLEQDIWESWIDLEITNNSSRRFAEYGTKINLPTGCWINDYYLFVEGKKEMGILTDKKSAMWVYAQIRNQNRDPGILNYTSGNEVAFRVFPFTANQTRKTGIKFIHKEPVTIQIDDEKVTLGDKELQQPLIQSLDRSKNTIYISSREKASLPKIRRSPYFHFIIDASIGKESQIQNAINRIHALTAAYPDLVHDSKVTFTNFKNITFDLSDNWESELKKYKFEGGFYLEKTIKKILFGTYHSRSLTSPRIVAITDNLNGSIIEKNFADFNITFPDYDVFYSMNLNNILLAHSLIKNPKRILVDHQINLEGNQVYCWPDIANPSAFLKVDDKSGIVLNKSDHTLEELNINPWESALQMHGQWISQCLHPETSDERWLNLIKGSFNSRILTPLTSFIVVENEAQKALLRKKQNQVLNGHKNLDLNGDIQSMAEPGIWLFLILFFGYLNYKKRYLRTSSLPM